MHRVFFLPSTLLFLAFLIGGCSDRTANPPEDPRISVSPFRNPILAGDTVTLFATIDGGDPSSIRWEMIPGPADYGSITPQGFYTAPRSIVDDSIYVRVKAISSATSYAATATIVVARGEFRHLVAPIGSTFTYSSYAVDSAGKVVTGSEGQRIATLTSTTATLGGRDNVALFAAPADTTIICYLPGGDVMYGLGTTSNLHWRTLLFGSRSDVIDRRPDSLTEGGGHVSDTTRISYVGQEVVPVGTKAFVARRMRQITERVGTGAEAFTEHITEDIWYAGAIGAIVKVDRSSERTQNGVTRRSGHRQSLVGFQLH